MHFPLDTHHVPDIERSITHRLAIRMIRMSGKGAAALLVSCIKDRNLKHNTSELLSEIERGGHQGLEAWVLENLGRETLLTKEELSLYVGPLDRYMTVLHAKYRIATARCRRLVRRRL